MTGKEISEELDKLNKDITVIFNSMIILESELARDEISKTLSVLGNEVKKKNNTEYEEIGKLELICPKDWDGGLIKYGNQKFRIKACELDSPIKHRKSEAEKEMDKPMSKWNYYDSL